MDVFVDENVLDVTEDQSRVLFHLHPGRVEGLALIVVPEEREEDR